MRCSSPKERIQASIWLALPGRGEGSRSNDSILFVDDRCDVKIRVGINAADDATYSFDNRHSQPPG
jgi:hypothetical protein